MTPPITLPTNAGGLRRYQPIGVPLIPSTSAPPRTRVAYAAAHVVADPLADNTPGQPAALDWDATLQFRRHLWELGLGVADAMDTAQRGMGLDWTTTAELIQRSAAEAAQVDGALACGAGTDQLGPEPHDLAAIQRAYEEQLELIEHAGATAVLMASRQLCAASRGAEDFHQVYGHLLAQASRPVLLHWLGPMFDPALSGYWGSLDLDTATETLLGIIATNPGKVDGVKISLLDRQREIGFRRRLPEGIRCYTGDDFNYPELIAGDPVGHSDALLGIFDPIAVPAASALAALDVDAPQSFHEILGPTLPVARHIFSAPTFYYKTGIVFLAWLAGHQSHFTMVSGLHSARSVRHLAELFVLADQAGLYPDPDLATERMRLLMALAGVSG